MLLYILPISIWGGVPLSLDSCIQLAQTNNKQIIQANINIHKAQQVKQQAFTKFFPQVSASAMGFHSLYPMVEVGINDLENATIRDILTTLYGNYGAALGLENSLTLFQHGYQVGITALQPVYMGGKIVTGNKLADLGVQAAQLQSQITSRDVIQEVEECYWLVVGLNDKQQTLNTTTLLLDTLHQTIEQAVISGLALQTDLLQVELKQLEIQRTQIQLTNGLELAKRALCLALGIPFNDSIQVDSLQHLPIDEASLSPIHVAKTPEHQLLDLQVNAAKLQHKMVVAEALPQIAIGAHYGYGKMQANLLKEGLGNKSGNGALFVTISVPLTSWWETSYKIKEQESNIEQSQLQQQHIGQMLDMRTQQAYNQLGEAILLVNQNEKAKQIALQNYQLVQTAYQAGQKTISELLEAQATLLKAKNDLTDAIISLRVSHRRYNNLGIN